MKDMTTERTDWREVSRLAETISRSLKGRETGGTRFEVNVKGGGDGVAARCTIIIRSPTYDEAFKHAEELTDAGWVCGSSGDNEFTCTGPDEE